jgi:hypothetical protein
MANQQTDERIREAEENRKKEIEALTHLKEKELRNALENAEKEKDAAIEDIQNLAIKEREEALQQKDVQFQNLLDTEREKVECRMQDEMARNIRIRDKEEKGKLKELRTQFDKMKAEDEMYKESLHREIEHLKQSASDETQKKMEEIQKQTETRIKTETDLVSK